MPTKFERLPKETQKMILQMLNDMEKDELIKRLVARLSNSDIIKFISIG